MFEQLTRGELLRCAKAFYFLFHTHKNQHPFRDPIDTQIPRREVFLSAVPELLDTTTRDWRSWGYNKEEHVATSSQGQEKHCHRAFLSNGLLIYAALRRAV